MNKKPLGDLWQYPVQKYPRMSILDYFDNEYSRSYKFIDSNTKVCSMGSCFGIEVAKFLKKMNFKYLVTEPNPFFSARWDKLYNVSSIRQVFDYSFGDFDPIVRWWERNGQYQDPFRRNVLYNPKTAHKQLINHIKCSFKALNNADVITITLGMSELWRDKRDGATYFRVPPREYYDENIHEFHIQDVEEIVSEMEKIRKNVPKTKIIWTLSPVAYMATFRQDIDPICSNFISKSRLRVAIDEFVTQDKNSYYFPSFEYIILGHSEPFINGKDHRHIKPKIISNTLSMFKRLFLK